MKLTISIEYAHDEDLPDITVEQVKKALQKFIVPSRSLHIYRAVEHSVHPTGGTYSQLVSMVNSLANIIIESSGKDGYLSSNDLDYANDCLDKVIPLLKPTSG